MFSSPYAASSISIPSIGFSCPLQYSLAVQVSSQALPEWDESVKASTCGSLKLYHGVAWSQRMRSLLGYMPLFFTVSENGQPILRLVAYLGRPWRIRGLGNSLRQLLPAVRRGRVGSLIWYGEPVILSPAHSGHYRRLALRLDEEARRRWLRVASGAWPVAHEDVLVNDWGRGRWGTILIDLTQTKEELLAAMKSSSRKALRRAERDGITVRRITTLSPVAAPNATASGCTGLRISRVCGSRSGRGPGSRPLSRSTAAR